MKMRRPAPVPVRRPPVVQDDRMMVGTLGGPGYGEFPLGTAGPRIDPSDPRYVPPPSEDSGIAAPIEFYENPPVPGEDYIPFVPPENTRMPPPPGNIQDIFDRMRDKLGRTPRRGPLPDKGPIYQPMPRLPRPPINLQPPMRRPPQLPRFPRREPEQPSRGGIGDLFRPYGSGLQDSPYGNLMDSIAEYGAGYNPYSQMGDFLMNRPVFDRGERPGSPMDMFRGPAAGGGGGAFEDALGKIRDQAPADQQRYEDYQRQMEEQRAQAEAERAASQAEADAAMQARFDELNQRLADQEAAAAAREQEYRTSGDAEREKLLARIAELEGAKPDLDAIRESIRADVMSNLPSQPSFDAEAIAKQVRDSMGLGDLNIADINERVAALQQSQADLAGKAQAAPQIDVDALRAQIQEGLNFPNIDVAEIQRRVREGINVPNIDVEDLRRRVQEGIKVPNVDVDAIRRQVQEGIELPDMDKIREDLARAQEGGRGTVMDPDVLARISALEGRDRPDLSGLENRIRELQGQIPQQIDVDALRQQIQQGIEIPDVASLQERLSEVEGRGTAIDPDILARIQQLEGRTGPDLSGIEQRIKELQDRKGPDLSGIKQQISELQGREIPDLSGLQERLAMIENQRARDAKGALNPARGPGVDKKGPNKRPPLRPVMAGGFGI